MIDTIDPHYTLKEFYHVLDRHPLLAERYGQLLKLFFLTLLFSLPLGLLIAFALRSRCKPVSWLFNVIVWIIRGTPLMLQLIII